MPQPNMPISAGLKIQKIQQSLDIETQLINALDLYLDRYPATAVMEQFNIAPLYAQLTRSILEQSKLLTRIKARREDYMTPSTEEYQAGPLVDRKITEKRG